MSKIKICGLSRREDILAVNQYRPDYCGFIFWEKSRRYVTPERAAELKGILNPEVRAVGVYVDADPDRIIRDAENGIVDVIQLHGHESGEEIVRLREQTGCPIIKAFKIRSEEDILQAAASCADYVLLDNGNGTGRTFQWEFLEKQQEKLKRDYFLAGGLSASNLAEAIRRFHPYAVDLSSSVETDGRKDPAKIAECIRIVRNVISG